MGHWWRFLNQRTMYIFPSFFKGWTFNSTPCAHVARLSRFVEAKKRNENPKLLKKDRGSMEVSFISSTISHISQPEFLPNQLNSALLYDWVIYVLNSLDILVSINLKIEYEFIIGDLEFEASLCSLFHNQVLAKWSLAHPLCVFYLMGNICILSELG